MNNQPQQYSKYKPLFFVSGLYFLIVLIIAISKLSDFAAMTPNEWGDFLAGTFAPLAFMWLVFGYRLQGEELKQNTEALRLQSEELANNVEQQRQLVETAREELSLSLDQIKKSANREILHSQPYVHLSVEAKNGSEFGVTSFERYKESEVEKLYLKFIFTNSRAIARDFRVTIGTENVLIKESKFNIFDKENPADFRCYLSYPECYGMSDKLHLKIICEYIDELDCNQKIEFIASVERNFEKEIQKTATRSLSRSF